MPHAVAAWPLPPSPVFMPAMGQGNSLVGVHGMVNTMCSGMLSFSATCVAPMGCTRVEEGRHRRMLRQ